MLALLVGGGVAAGSAREDSGPSSEAVPLFSLYRSLTLERGMPPAVQARVLREHKRRVKLARAAQRDPATPANGCVRNEYGSFGPPAPRVEARVLGYQVAAVVTFDRMPRSLACRPWRLRVYVHSSDRKLNPDTAGGFDIHTRRGRIVADLSWFGKPPYELRVNAESVLGVYGKVTAVPLKCPGTGERVRGCLSGVGGFGTLKPVLPLRGVTLASLEASLDYLLSAQRRPPILYSAPVSFECATVRRCDVTYVDRAFPDSPFRVRYQIVGQQVDGCWMGRHRGFLEERPHDNAGGGPPSLAACVSWVR
jgi:hypothetical protein